MNLRSLSQRERRLGILALALVILAVLYSWAVEPLVRRWTQLEDRISVAEARLLRDRRILLRQESIQKAYEKHASALQAGGSVEEEVGRLLQEVDRVGGGLTNTVRVRGLKPRAASDYGSYRLYGVEVEVEATLEHLARFIYDLEASPDGLRVARVYLGPAGGAGGLLEGRLVVTKMAVPAL